MKIRRETFNTHIHVTFYWFRRIFQGHSIKLYHELADNTKACGTLRGNRKAIPPALKEVKLKKSESSSLQSGKLVCMKYKDRKDLFMLNTKHTATNTERDKVDRTEEPVKTGRNQRLR